jgi:hypothetical protein
MGNRPKSLSEKEQALKDFQDLLELMDSEGPDHAVIVMRLLPRDRFLALCRHCG